MIQLLLLHLLAGSSSSFPTSNGRVVGGQDATVGQFPYQVSIQLDGSHYCGASILDDTTILTAAHCVVKLTPEEILILVGATKLSQGGDVYEVQKLIPHEGYKFRNSGHDIALIKLKKSIKFTSNIQPITLTTKDDFGGETCILTGWGKNGLPGIYPDNLQWVELKTIPLEDCMSFSQLVGKDELCTQVPEGKGTCSADSGGPLVNSKGQQIGIVSWGIPCATGRPDMYTRVYTFLDWIEENRA